MSGGHFTRVAWVAVVLISMAQAGCRPATEPTGSPSATSEPRQADRGKRPKTAVSVRGYNFTGEGVQDFSVDNFSVSNLPPYGGGGKTTCCVLLPEWREGLSVTVDWTIGRYTVPYEKRKHLSFEDQGRYWRERTLHQVVPVQRYDKPNTVQVFFLPDDKVEVWVTAYDLGHLDHPSRRQYPVNPDPKRFN